jgi:hypothetical protein
MNSRSIMREFMHLVAVSSRITEAKRVLLRTLYTNHHVISSSMENYPDAERQPVGLTDGIVPINNA